MGIENVNTSALKAPIDSLTEVVAPVSGVKVTVRESHHELYEFELVVSDLKKNECTDGSCSLNSFNRRTQIRTQIRTQLQL